MSRSKLPVPKTVAEAEDWIEAIDESICNQEPSRYRASLYRELTRLEKIRDELLAPRHP